MSDDNDEAVRFLARIAVGFAALAATAASPATAPVRPASLRFPR